MGTLVGGGHQCSFILFFYFEARGDTALYRTENGLAFF
jgi:hypothetical protein